MNKISTEEQESISKPGLFLGELDKEFLLKLAKWSKLSGLLGILMSVGGVLLVVLLLFLFQVEMKIGFIIGICFFLGMNIFPSLSLIENAKNTELASKNRDVLRMTELYKSLKRVFTYFIISMSALILIFVCSFQ